MTANERLAEAAIGHSVDLQHHSNAVVQKMLALLNRVDSELFARLMIAMESMPIDSFTVERLESLLVSVRGLNVQAYEAVGRALSAALLDFTVYEAAYQFELFKHVLPERVMATIGLNRVNAQQVYGAAMAQPFQGRLMSEWAKSIEAGRMARIRDAVRIGYVSGDTTSDIVKKIRGTKEKGFSDGIIELDRRHAETIVRSALSHTAAFTRDRFVKDNGDIIKAVQWVSTLDARTTLEFCVPRDGLQYTPDEHKPIGHKFAWSQGPGRIHWNCRSTSIAVLKSWRELGIPMEEMPAGERASMDGQVPAETTYSEWLMKQSASMQDQKLGAEKAAKLRSGEVTFDRFYNDKGRLLSLDELRARDAKAFAKAGI